MMHLTADRPITVAKRSVFFGMQAPAYLSKCLSTHHSFRVALWNSLSSLANFLELRCVGFHYSVISGDATLVLAADFVDCPLVNEEVPPLNPGTAAADAPRALAGDK